MKMNVIIVDTAFHYRERFRYKCVPVTSGCSMIISEDTVNDALGISRCTNGCVCLHFGMSVVHLQPHEFMKFVSMVNRALPEVTDDETLLAVAGQWGHA